ncbi:HAMP domain-containing sensor histidine kinase [Pedobacter sp. PLR]|uniref:HAMP domain-containing sensor histidine kinase n=1 Tax=Pedobacter sp. PLR TaxID=2994465 RepID=UPI00224540A0|nr:HAMP domain-containing sensor histidine kinase [Pedobacter sp. PLR]MCX2451842.1 HAMP domain-containing sensor histidine kinase [Pedobacter sp. PLR]
MKLKDRLSLYFTLISTLTLLAVLCAVYFTFIKFLEADFFDRLTDRTMVTAKLYLEADEISADSLNTVRNQYMEALNGEVIRIYNANNSATFIGDDQQYWSHETIEKVRKNKKIQFIDGDRQVVGIFYKDNQGDFVILASGIDQSTHVRIEKLQRIMVMIFVFIFIGLLLSGRWIAKKILKPLDLFIEEVKQIKSNNLHFRVQEGSNKDEINLLAQNFNNLMEHLEQAFVLQKTFIANASHELRTPVTRMMISAEITLSQERQIGDYKKALLSVMEDSEKMDNIITGLLNLAQADLEFGAPELQDIRIDESLWALSEEWNKKGSAKLIVGIKNMPEDPAHLLIRANPTLVEIALNNIISNAFKFSGNQDVHCLLDIQAKETVISISDKGPGIPEEIQPEIFKPFYSFSAESGHEGNGMGLYMAHKIIGLFNGKLEVNSEPGHGATFIIHFPKY